MKKALVELAPLRWNGARGELLWARRLQVRLRFAGLEPSERTSSGSGGTRHREEKSHRSRTVLARLVASQPGLYRVSLPDVVRSPRRSRASLRLSHLGESVPFHVESSTLYFLSGGDSVYELQSGPGALLMPVLDGSPSGAPVGSLIGRVEREENHYYQAGLLDAPSIWLWDVLVSPSSKDFAFTIRDGVPDEAQLEVFLQGASGFEGAPDHRVLLSVNGFPVGESVWDGMAPMRFEAPLPAGVLRDGENQLSIENAGSAAAPYSMVFLDRFTVTYRRRAVAEIGSLEGRFDESGTVAVDALSPGSVVIQTSPQTAWLQGVEGTSFHVEAGRSYLAVSPESVLQATILRPATSGLRNTRNGADYLLIGPREFLPAAEPLLRQRQRQGLVAMGVAIEDVYDDFGFGEARPEALKEFLEYAYHHWRGGAPRYVVLFGDATYDRKDYLQTGVRDRVPAWMRKTSYLWTASDPTYAAVNGEDELPDLALGRLPAATLEEARTLVDKVLEYEASGQSLSGRVVLVADNPDAAGDFEKDSDEIAAGVGGREVQEIYLRELG
ncbi:MAG TPA: C25 family cysteine peptidase, partial [Vicinamibacteria bacterium]